MISIEIKKSFQGNIIGFYVEGHAKPEGEMYQIVCSAVSALFQTAALGLAQIAGVKLSYADWNGCILCKITGFPDDISKIKAQAILDTMYLGIRKIKEEYSQYIHVVEKEEV